jgi:hypothetical protein
MLDNVKLTYARGLKPSKWNTVRGQVYAYVVGRNLMFTPSDSPYIHVVGLLDGDATGANRRGGSYPWAGYITLNGRSCHRS